MSRRRPRRPVWVPPGILALEKAPGPTSHDMVALVRGQLPRGAKVGHAGTLDPFAEGVLPICVGGATRLADRVGEGRKTYLAELDLSASTDTGDRTGEVVARTECPAEIPAGPLEEAVRSLTGEIMQTPPAYSAVRVGGRRAYELARAGETPDLAPRPVTIHSLEVLERAGSRLTFRTICSRGTYVRVLGEDLGRRLGLCGHLTRLVREAVGALDLARAVKPVDVLRPGGVAAACLPLEVVLEGAAALSVSPPGVERLLHGAAPDPEHLRPRGRDRVGGGGGAAPQGVGPATDPRSGAGSDPRTGARVRLWVLYPEGAEVPVAVATGEEEGALRPLRVFGVPPGPRSDGLGGT